MDSFLASIRDSRITNVSNFIKSDSLLDCRRDSSSQSPNQFLWWIPLTNDKSTTTTDLSSLYAIMCPSMNNGRRKGAMNDKSTSIRRSELYKEVWTTPIHQLAKKYGLSDVGLARFARNTTFRGLPGDTGCRNSRRQRLLDSCQFCLFTDLSRTSFQKYTGVRRLFRVEGRNRGNRFQPGLIQAPRRPDFPPDTCVAWFLEWERCLFPC